MSSQPRGKEANPQSGSRQETKRAPSLMVPIFKLPLFLYRIGLGRLMGTRFMLLTHLGRHSHRLRRTILAVLSFDGKTKEIKMMSAWSGSDWFRNIEAAPAVEVERGSVRYKPAQRELTHEEIASLFLEYSRKHPIFSNIVCRIPGWKANSTYEEFLQLARTLHGFAFRPAG